MSTLLRFTPFCLILIVIAGCAAGIKGRADRPTYLAASTSYYASDIKAALDEATSFKARYYCMLGLDTSDDKSNNQSDTKTVNCPGTTPPSTERLLAVRNDFAYKMLQAHELSLQDYARSLSVEGRGGAFATTLAVLGLGSASTIINNSSTQSLLSGISTGLLGARESYSKDVLAENAVGFVLVRITAAHLNQRAKILVQLSENYLTYPLSALELDLDNLSRVSSFEVALSNIAASVDEILDDSEQDVLIAKPKFNFSQNEFTLNLDGWLEIDDKIKFARRVKDGKAWLAENDIEADLFVFISDAKTFGHRYRDFVEQVILK